MALPVLDEVSRKMPVSYCPTCDRFIYYDEIKSGECAIIPPDTLSEADQKKLVIKRYEVAPDLPESGPMSRLSSPQEIIRMIEKDEPDGNETVRDTISYLSWWLGDIARQLAKRDERPDGERQKDID